MFLNNLFSKIFRNQNRLEYTTGKAVPLEEIYLSELEKYPIWIYALDEEDVEGQDEFWVKPITNSTNVEAELSTPYILLKIKENNCPVSALLDIKNMKLDDLQMISYFLQMILFVARILHSEKKEKDLHLSSLDSKRNLK